MESNGGGGGQVVNVERILSVSVWILDKLQLIPRINI